MAKNKKNTIINNKGDVEYKMTKEMANFYLMNRKGIDKNKPSQEYLCEIVNNDFNIKGNCIRVLTTL